VPARRGVRCLRDRQGPIGAIVLEPHRAGATEARKYLGHWIGDVHQPLHVSFRDHRGGKSAPVVERFLASHCEPEGYSYAAVQVWAQAAKKAGSLELQAMIASLREHQFDTVLGPIDFDEKCDLAVQNPVWWIWGGDTYVPLEPSP
jgi:S1/P1 Nuclease